MVIETHTKDFFNNIKDIDKFFKYLKNNYSDIEFITTSDLLNDIESNLLKPING